MHYKSAYYAAQPGLGKTPVALELARQSGLPVVYACPPSLVRNVRREVERWAPEIMLDIVPDTQLAKARVSAAGAFLILDEAHRYKNADAQRTKLALALAKPAARVLLLSGTPLPNSRALEIWPLVSALAPDVFNLRKWAFMQRYCAPSYRHQAGRRVETFDGLSHAEEFYSLLTKSWMVRQDKSLLTLPPKIESLVMIGAASPRLCKLDALARTSLHDKMALDGPVATYRRELGEEKIGLALDWLKEQVASSPQNSFLLFAHHKAVLATLSQAFPDAIVITGGTPIATRQALVDSFQSPTGPRVAILSIQASGVGHTLTKADRVIFVESDWVDGINEQAADRSHRIGQRNSVYVQYLILEGTYDAEVLTKALEKRKNSIDYYTW